MKSGPAAGWEHRYLNKRQTRAAKAQLAGGVLTCQHTGRRVYMVDAEMV